MKTYTITQKIISLGANYQVRISGSDEVIMNAKGKIVTITPLLELRKGPKTDEKPDYIMKGNFLKTKFSIQKPDGTSIAEIKFPYISIFKKFSLILNEKIYEAKGSITAWKFECKDESQQIILSISKEFSFKDKFTINVNEAIQHEVAILTAVAVDQRFFQSQS